MEEHTYKHLEITGSSKVSSDDAIHNAILKASKTTKNMHWFEVINMRGSINADSVQYWQVTIKIGSRLDD